jgi:protein TonB
MSQQESVPVPRGWTGGAAWKGAGASLLLHLFVGAAVIVALSGPPKAVPQVIDLTLLPPADIGWRPVAHVFAAAAEQERDDGPVVPAEPPPFPAAPTHVDRPAVSTPARSRMAEEGNAPAAGTEPSRPAATYPPSSGVGTPSGSPPGSAASAWATPGENSEKSSAGKPSGKSGARSPLGDFAWIRDAIQGAIAYPATARRMGWEGKVVVAFQLLSDGSVRDVRVVQGSGHAALDRGAIDAVRNASPFPRSPVEAEVITPVVYRLTTR